MDNLDLNMLPELLLPWYRENHRCLPWRETKEPYHIWLSEIMLQQTRVEAVKGYYARFLAALPTVEALANCDDDALHKLWEGLGYYSRVRNLKKAAQVIQERYNGQFPREYDAVLALPGIGEYTAGAICSIAFDLPVPAVDGNVLRVFSRLTDAPSPIDLPAVKASVRERLAAIYPKEAGDFTQALMERNRPMSDFAAASYMRGLVSVTERVSKMLGDGAEDSGIVVVLPEDKGAFE